MHPARKFIDYPGIKTVVGCFLPIKKTQAIFVAYLTARTDTDLLFLFSFIFHPTHVTVSIPRFLFLRAKVTSCRLVHLNRAAKLKEGLVRLHLCESSFRHSQSPSFSYVCFLLPSLRAVSFAISLSLPPSFHPFTFILCSFLSPRPFAECVVRFCKTAEE
jgi:hypothetical protein